MNQHYERFSSLLHSGYRVPVNNNNTNKTRDVCSAGVPYNIVNILNR